MISLKSFILEDYANAKGGDEFYTRYQDIEKELQNYNLKNLVVYCNCDDPAFSNFWKYLFDNFQSLGLKHLVATYYDSDPLRYDYDGKEVIKTPIESGDFTKNEDIIKESDIIITNPPYSNKYPQKLINLAISNRKKIIMVGPKMLPYRKDVFDFFKDGTMHCGYTLINTFDRPGEDSETDNAASGWYTNMPVKKEQLVNNRRFRKSEYTIDDSGKYLVVKYYKQIPDDFTGLIATSINFINHLNYDQFEIIGHGKVKINGKTTFEKLFIKRKR